MMRHEAAEREMPRTDEASRVRLAASPGTDPAVLLQLADDPEIVVRAAVAINRSSAPEVDRILTEDEDERVRALLAGRIARLLPTLVGQDRTVAAAHVHSVLAVLVTDEAVRVRVAIADSVKTMPDAPHDLILRLARDKAFEVSDPVIRLSPVLTDADLLELLATPPQVQTAVAIAGRPGLSPVVAEAVAAHASAPAVQVMLANRSCCIREATLDALVGRAAHHADWHEPFVRRPALSARAIRALSGLVSSQLLEALARRTDLDPAVAQALRERVAAANRQLEPERPGQNSALADLDRLQNDRKLDESILLDAARSGDLRRLGAALAVASGVPPATVERVVGLRSAKALLSLVWRAGFGMRVGVIVQSVLGQLGPASILAPAADGGFPLSEDEMKWHLEMLCERGWRRATSERGWN